MELLRWLLVLMGLVYFFTESALWGPVRIALVERPDGGQRLGWRVLVYCRSCTGFWVGCALGALGYWPFAWPQGAPLWATWAQAGVAAVESGAAAMAVGAMWTFVAPSDAYEREFPE